MKKLILASLAVILAACTSSNTGKNITLDDSLSLSDFVWTREPESFAIKGDTIEVTIRLKQAIIRLQIELGALTEYVCPPLQFHPGESRQIFPRNTSFYVERGVFAFFSPGTTSNGRYGMIFLIYYPV